MKTTQANRSQRALIAQETLTILENGVYNSAQNRCVIIKDELRQAVSNSIHYAADSLDELRSSVKIEPHYDTVISVRNESCLSAARRLTEQLACSPLCLNFASAKNPGGGFLGGSEAQEENLAKSSGLYACIVQKTEMYEKNRAFPSCSYLDDMIYSPDVPVFRDDDYALLEQNYLVSFITCPAVNLGAMKKNKEKHVDQVAEIMQNRINLVLAVAYKHGHKNLVLGAWGCGVFANDPSDVPKYFFNAVKPGSQFHGAFERIDFAVLDKNNTGSFAAFEAAFKELRKQ